MARDAARQRSHRRVLPRRRARRLLNERAGRATASPGPSGAPRPGERLGATGEGAPRPLRIGIVSDTHLPRGSRRILAACLERLAASDLIVHAGDFSSLAALEELSALGPPVTAVHGNVDEPALRARLPAEHTFVVAGARMGLIHDAGPSRGRLARMRRRFPDAEAVVFGHSHIPLHEAEADLQIFNPGSPTERRRAPRHTMGMATVEGGRIRFEHVVLD